MRVSIPQGTIKSLDIDAPRSYSFVSIPQGTIKSALENKIENKPFRVSIPQGTIKRSGGRGAARRGGRFQFHKVRLKESLELREVKDKPVSIPQGTIKSSSGTSFANNLSAVSIPQGTIKRRKATPEGRRVAAFQFHKVRLKGKPAGYRSCKVKVSIPQGTIKSRLALFCAASLFVSIPQGTIKSVDSGNIRFILSVFQFHKVRLKVCMRETSKTFTLFQFHKVRLKELQRKKKQICSTVSIP